MLHVATPQPFHATHYKLCISIFFYKLSRKFSYRVKKNPPLQNELCGTNKSKGLFIPHNLICPLALICNVDLHLQRVLLMEANRNGL